MPDLTAAGRAAPLRVSVDSLQRLRGDVVVVKLVSTTGQLPTFQPGAHIDVHLGNGLVRQYSLMNGPGQTDCYVIAVKREKDSAGGSTFIHDSLTCGDVLAISSPRNNFPLRRDAVDTLLIAGGIGITPLLSMAQALVHNRLPVKLHGFFRDAAASAAFADWLAALDERVTLYEELSVQQTEETLHRLLSNYATAHHVYLCGPPAMISAARDIAAEHGWPDEAVHFEYFNNTTERSLEGSFSVSLARSGLTLEVPAGTSLLDVLRANGVNLPSSCEQGACGTCKVSVIEGQPLHQDVYLNKAEQARGDCMMSCVSRAISDSLTLDI
jgi:ferredoxin-NADP reductase